MKARELKEHIAFWLIIAGCPLLATSENLGLMLVLVMAIVALMWDNITEALNKKDNYY